MDNPLVLMARTRQSESEEESDLALVEAAQANIAAFEALYERYVMRVYHYLHTRVESNEDAQDLTQQVFLKALAAFPRYRVRGAPFGAWLFQIARHIVTDNHRRQRSSISWDMLSDMLYSSPELNPETILLQQEAQVQLQSLLEGLDSYKRELLALRFAAGLSSQEIADVVGKSHASVKKQLTRLLHTLKEAYHEA